MELTTNTVAKQAETKTDIKVDNKNKNEKDKTEDELNEKIKYVFEEVKKRFASSIRDMTTVQSIDIVLQLMVIVSKFKELKGEIKKKIVLSVLNLLITSTGCFNNDTAIQLKTFIDLYGSSVIDKLVWVGNQALKFNPKGGCLCC